MALLIQAIGIFFALSMIFMTYLYYRRNIFYFHDLAIWLLIWMGLLFTILFPLKLEMIIEPLQILRVMDLLTIAAFFISFSLLFIVFTWGRRRDRKIERIVRKLALEEEGQKLREKKVE